jgi:hypothetical protein
MQHKNGNENRHTKDTPQTKATKIYTKIDTARLKSALLIGVAPNYPKIRE